MLVSQNKIPEKNLKNELLKAKQRWKRPNKIKNSKKSGCHLWLFP
jgi:hypothetical protein